MRKIYSRQKPDFYKTNDAGKTGVKFCPAKLLKFGKLKNISNLFKSKNIEIPRPKSVEQKGSNRSFEEKSADCFLRFVKEIKSFVISNKQTHNFSRYLVENKLYQEKIENENS